VNGQEPNQQPATVAGVDPANREQSGNWNGSAGEFWTEWADRFDHAAAAYGRDLLAAAAIEPSAAVLDVGCGAGSTTRDAARRAAQGWALGIDLSARQLELARRRARDEQVTNVTFEQADAQVHPFAEASFDVAISRHGTMFFGDPATAFANIAKALRPGARMVLVTWQPFARNEWIRTFLTTLAAGGPPPAAPEGAPGPFGLSDPARLQSLLGAAGFEQVQVEGRHEPMYVGADPEDASRFVTGQYAGLVGELDPTSRAGALESLHASLSEHHSAEGVIYDSAAWLVRARRSPRAGAARTARP
jgi:SAM-dependent methyltransferase